MATITPEPNANVSDSDCPIVPHLEAIDLAVDQTGDNELHVYLDPGPTFKAVYVEPDAGTLTGALASHDMAFTLTNAGEPVAVWAWETVRKLVRLARAGAVAEEVLAPMTESELDELEAEMLAIIDE